MQGEAATFAKLGHMVCRAEGDLPCVFCARCGGWAARRSHRLRAKCEPPTLASKLARKRIAEGKHPWRRKKKGGGEEDRTAAHAAAAFDDAQGRWKRRKIDHANGGPAVGPASANENRDLPAAGGACTDAGGDNAMIPEAAAETRSSPSMDITEMAPARDPSVEGTSMRMIINVLRHAPASMHRHSTAAIFNGASGRIVTTTLGAIEAERDWLRRAGSRMRTRGLMEVASSAPAPTLSAAATSTRAELGATSPPQTGEWPPAATPMAGG